MNALRAARQARGLSLAEIATTTRLSPRYVRALDEGRFDDLPPGLYARAYAKAFAGAVHLDPAELERILPLLPALPDPVGAIKENRARARVRGVPRHSVLRLCVALSIDAFLLLVLARAILATVAATCGMASVELLETAPFPIAVLCATTWLEYFLLFAGVQGRTPGERVCGLPERPSRVRLDLSTILQRATFPSERLSG